MTKYLKPIINDDEAVLAWLKESQVKTLPYAVRYSLRKFLEANRPDRDFYYEVYPKPNRSEDVIAIFKEYQSDIDSDDIPDVAMTKAIERLKTPSRIYKFKMIYKAVYDEKPTIPKYLHKEDELVID